MFDPAADFDLDMAIRLGKLLGNGPEIWLRMQQAVDVWTLQQRGGYDWKPHKRLTVPAYFHQTPIKNPPWFPTAG